VWWYEAVEELQEDVPAGGAAKSGKHKLGKHRPDFLGYKADELFGTGFVHGRLEDYGRGATLGPTLSPFGPPSGVSLDGSVTVHRVHPTLALRLEGVPPQFFQASTVRGDGHTLQMLRRLVGQENSAKACHSPEPARRERPQHRAAAGAPNDGSPSMGSGLDCSQCA